MKAILNIRMLSLRAALLPVLAVGLLLQNAQAQSSNQNQKTDNKASGSSQAQAPKESSKPAAKESAPAKEEQTGGPHEGIKIHGHWVIDVRNPDGKLVTHREFENAYYPGNFPSNILARQYSFGFWIVALHSASNFNYYDLLEASDTGSAFGTSNTVASRNLAISSSGGAFVLSGSFVAGTSDSIDSVVTEDRVCDPSVPPGTPCQQVAPGFAYAFTATTLSPVSFISGQLVQVSVTISFS